MTVIEDPNRIEVACDLEAPKDGHAAVVCNCSVAPLLHVHLFYSRLAMHNTHTLKLADHDGSAERWRTDIRTASYEEQLAWDMDVRAVARRLAEAS